MINIYFRAAGTTRRLDPAKALTLTTHLCYRHRKMLPPAKLETDSQNWFAFFVFAKKPNGTQCGGVLRRMRSQRRRFPRLSRSDKHPARHISTCAPPELHIDGPSICRWTSRCPMQQV